MPPVPLAPSPAAPAPAAVLAGAGRARSAPGTVHVTLRPGTDVLLDAGTRLGDARAALADLTCRPELLTVPLLVDGVPVDDDHRCGTRPLLPGATISVAGPGRHGGGADVLAAPWHVAVVAGSDAGRLVPVGDPGTGAGGRRASIPGPAWSRPRARGRVAVDDLVVRWVRTRSGVRFLVRAPRGTRRVHDGAALVPGRRGRRVASWRSVRWRAGRTLVTRCGAYALRPRPGLEHVPRPLPGPDPASTPATGEPGRSWTTQLTTALVPAVASLALAVTFRQPLYALLALTGPLALLVPALVEALRRRAARRSTEPGRTGGTTAAARASEAAGGRAAGAPDASDDGPADPLNPRPADVLTWATVAHRAPAARRARADRRSGPLPGTRALDDGAAPGSVPAEAQLPDGCVAVVGPSGAARAAARAVLAELLVEGATVTVRHVPSAAAEWSWCRWLPGARAAPWLDGDTPARADADVLVVDGETAPGELASAWERLGPAGTRLVIVADDRARVPAWCRTVLDVSGPTAVLVGADGVRTSRPHVGVSAAWAHGLARHLAAAAHLGRLGPRTETDPDPADPTAPSLPADVSLGALLGTPTDGVCDWVAARWADAARRDGRALRCPLGVGSDGTPVTVDLVADGPHVLVAGTTGAGKSELLQTLVTGLALGRSPAELTFALVDFKGGASFGACGDLPHVVGQVTDLDPGLAGRALAGLRAELHRRERVLGGLGAASVDELPTGRLPRLVVVVDEFRALADDLPEFLPGLLRIAAQGRSLGVHLVLATQRPTGAVSADVRANITLRLALRVVDVADSRDVVESPHAALVPASTPGRLVLRRGAEPPVALQCARASAPAPDGGAGARLAPAWGTAPRPPDAPRRHDGSGDVLTRVVAAAREVAERSGLPRPVPPWLPALPTQVSADDVPDAHDGPGVPVALGDVPADQRRDVVRWDPRDGHLAVLGRARSGRTTALRTVALAALARGWTVHAVGAGLAGLAGHPGTGTVVDRSDVRRLARLLRLLAGHDDGQERPDGLADGARTLVVVDDVEAARGALAALAGGAGADLLADALADSGAAFAVAGSGPTVAGLASLVGVRAVLTSRDRHDDVSLGVPTALAGQGGPAGRAVWLGSGEPVVCQLALAEELPLGARRDGRRAAPGDPRPARGPVRLAPLPDRVHVRELDPGVDGAPAAARGATTEPDAEDARWPGGPLVPVGRGGDHAGTLALDVSRGALVAGPPGSGRTNALTLLARHAAVAGVLRGVVARDDALVALAGPDVRVVTRHSPVEVGGLLEALAAGGSGRSDVVVVDDLDLLGQLCALEAEQLGALCRDGLVLLASTTTAAAAMALRGPLTDLRGVRAGIVLGPGERGSAEVFGHGLEWLTDPGRPRPGRGVVVQGGRAVPVQVAVA